MLKNKKTANLSNDMAKIQNKSEKLTPFEDYFQVMEQFDSILFSVIDSTLGLRSKTVWLSI